MRTIVYIDGYNLYYGRIKHTDFKWLDLYKLFNEHILPYKSRDSNLVIIKYFTADIKANFATLGTKSSEAQKQYISALEQSY